MPITLLKGSRMGSRLGLATRVLSSHLALLTTLKPTVVSESIAAELSAGRLLGPIPAALCPVAEHGITVGHPLFANLAWLTGQIDTWLVKMTPHSL
jgi:hypothetical protein